MSGLGGLQAGGSVADLAVTSNLLHKFRSRIVFSWPN